MRVNIQTRNPRQINAIHLQVPFSKDDRVAVGALYFKFNDGHRLLSLNKNNIPIRGWSDIRSRSAVKCSIIMAKTFQSVLNKINPSVIYLNDGEHIDTSQLNIKVITNMTFMEMLKYIEIKPETLPLVETDTPTFETMKLLDPTLSKKEYSKIISKWS